MKTSMPSDRIAPRPSSRSFPTLAVVGLVATALLAGCGQTSYHHSHDHDHAHDHDHDHVTVATPAPGPASAPYMLETCPVSGEKLGSMGEPVVYSHEGRELRFCCDGCISPFEKDPAQYLEKVDAAMIERLRPDYPLDTCVVAGSKLGSMGEPYAHIYRNQLVLFCCDGCLPAFRKDPARYLTMIRQASSQ
jgi:YHS domain-containing protein